ncbi:MAG: hypothetical protein WCI27_11825, partial [Candidatus Omnitrophota bacterium]
QAVNIESRMGDLRAKNEKILSQMAGRERDDSAELARLKRQIDARDDEVLVQKDALLVLKTRLSAVRKRSSLAQLRVSELELEKKSRELDGRAQGNVVLNDMSADVARLKERIVVMHDQTRVLLENTAGLGRIQRPYLPRIREVTALMQPIKERLAALKLEKAAYVSKLHDLDQLKSQSGRDKNARRIRQLLAERTALEARFKENNARLEDLKSKKADPGLTIPDFAAKASQIEQENKGIEEEIGELRENIALLEYKVNTLQRYKDRNKPAPQAKRSDR